MSEAFEWYGRSYKVKIVGLKDPLAKLELVNQDIKDLRHFR